VLLLIFTAFGSAIIVAIPLMLRLIINNGILPRRVSVVTELSLGVAGLALVAAAAVYLQTRYSARVGQGLIYDLRVEVFGHVQRLPLAFFTRSQTGSLVSRLNTDIVMAQQAVTTLMSQAVSIMLSLILVLAAMLYLSWQVTIIAVGLIPGFLYLSRVIGRKLQKLTRKRMELTGELASLMDERFNVGGAILVKLYGRPEQEQQLAIKQAAEVRDITITTTMYGQAFTIIMTLVTALTTALVYGMGGALVISGAYKIGTLVALVTLLAQLYGPVNQLSGLQVNALTALVSFERLFEVLDLVPLITERPGAYALPGSGPGADVTPGIEFDQVCFRYPAASQVSLESLESVSLSGPETDGEAWVLTDLSFRLPPGRMTALVGPSGAGKTTITQLVPRLYDPDSGTVRIGGHDLRDLTLGSLQNTIGVVPQEVHMFHDTIRANLLYARPDATEKELTEACEAARIWEMIASLPDRLDTVVGDRGYRLSGGEKQRVAMARLLLKAPPVVVLDEATAHLDAESEAAIQRALKTALHGRTALVIAHRLSTIREADQILVIDQGRVRERGTHAELIAANGMYGELYRTQFAPMEKVEKVEKVEKLVVAG
jgi:ATP-binding cassette subfamily B protein